MGFGTYISLVMALLWVMIPTFPAGLLISPVVIMLALMMLHRWLMWQLDRRPRSVLLSIADQMERGQIQLENQPQILPGELHVLQQSDLPAEVRAITIAELIPQVASMRIVRHRIASRLLAPLLISGLLFSGMYVFFLVVVPNFRQMFVGFGIELPWLTNQLMSFSWILEVLSLGGLLAFVGVIAATLSGLYLVITRDSFQSYVQGIPFLGTAIRWAMQARIARVLAVLIRNHADPQRSLVIATASSGMSDVAATGKRLSEELVGSENKWMPGPSLSGIPLSLMIRLTDNRCTEENRQETAQVFAGVAAALESACVGQGAFIGLFVEMFVIFFGGIILAFVVISLFLPLIRLMRDLTVITGWWL